MTVEESDGVVRILANKFKFSTTEIYIRMNDSLIKFRDASCLIKTFEWNM